MSTLKRQADGVIIFGVIFGLLVAISTAPTTDIPSTTMDDSSSQESFESDSSRWTRDATNEIPPIISASPDMVLKPNVTGALDVGHGLLVPLVPVVDPNSNPPTTQVSPLVANLLPIAIESVTTTELPDVPQPEVRRSLEDMDVAEDIVFRPLFRYRQEARQKYLRNRYYQPYIYAYKNRNNNYYQSYENM
ncbi:uncharacterized protein [Fopius arisanus]|uniref:Uncharacterized protein n=1 Tax=Fopius arisanus TaxID=64838 RepID=A0A9R1U9L2_9HYME|nr:PREDICTED: uncharacterized protein LOC105272842 [Fopius arisanus]